MALFCVTIKHGTGRFTLKMRQHPDAVRERAEKLRRTVRGAWDGQPRRVRREPVSRPKTYNKTLAQSFLDDGDKESWASYRALFDA